MEGVEVVGFEPKLTREEQLEHTLIESQRALARTSIEDAKKALILCDIQQTQLGDRIKARVDAEKKSAEVVPLVVGEAVPLAAA